MRFWKYYFNTGFITTTWTVIQYTILLFIIIIGTTPTTSSTSRKRCLQFSDTDDMDDIELDKEKNLKGKKTAVENELWNDIHCSLVRDLEKKGAVGRYGVQ